MSQKSLPAVAYIRMSTDKQEDSPARQRGEIERYAKEHGYKIQEWYQDHGKSGTTSHKRKDFQRLMSDAKSGGFKFVLMYEQSRFSREDMLQFAHHLYELREVGVKLVTTLKGPVETDDIGGMFMTLLESYKNREESQTLAHRVTSAGRRNLIDLRECVPRRVIGYDRVILAPDGSVVRRVPYTEKFNRGPGQSQRLEPTADVAVVEAIRWAFLAVQNGASLYSVACGLRERGIVTSRGKSSWRLTTVKYMLTNPTYCGYQRIGQFARGRFAKITPEPVIQEASHPAIVSPETFANVGRIIKARSGERRPVVRDKKLLITKLICGHCGARMFSSVYHSKEAYRCGQYAYGPRSGADACSISVQCQRLDDAVWKAIEREVFSDENLSRADIAWREQRSENPPLGDATRVDELEKKIRLATERLAGDVLDKEEFAAVSRIRHEWRLELRNLQKKSAPPSPVNVSGKLSLEQLRASAENCTKFGDGRRRDLVLSLVESVTFFRQSNTEARAILELNPEVYFGAPIELSADDIYPDAVWRNVCNFVRESKSELRLGEIARRFGMRTSGAHHALATGIRAGLVEKTAENGYRRA